MNGTQLDNYRDQIAAKTNAVREKHGKAKLTWEIVNSMRQDYANGMPVCQIVKKYNTKYSSTWSTIKHIIWKTL